MITLEGTLEAIWNFIRRLANTFVHSILKLNKLGEHAINKTDNYINEKAYLLISIFINVLMIKGVKSSKGFLGILNYKYYQDEFYKAKDYSIFDVIFITAPYTIASYCFLYLLVKLFRFPTYQKKLSLAISIYLFGTVRIIIITLFLPLVLFVGKLSDWLDGEFSSDTANIFSIVICILVPAIVVSLPLILFKPTNLFANRRYKVKIVILYITIVISTVVTIYPFWETYAEPEKPIYILNSRLEDDQVIIYYSRDSNFVLTLSCAFIIDNKSNKTCYLLNEKTLWMRLNDKNEVYLDNELKYKDVDNEAQLIKSGDYSIVRFTKKVDAKLSGRINQLILRNSDSTHTSVFFDLQTIKPNLIGGIFRQENDDVEGIFRKLKRVKFYPKSSISSKDSFSLNRSAARLKTRDRAEYSTDSLRE